MTSINWSAVNTFNDFVQVPVQAYPAFWVMVIYFLMIVLFGVTLLFQGMEVAFVFTGFAGLITSLPLAFTDPPVVGWWVPGSFVGMLIFAYLYHEFSNHNK